MLKGWPGLWYESAKIEAEGLLLDRVAQIERSLGVLAAEVIITSSKDQREAILTAAGELPSTTRMVINRSSTLSTRGVAVPPMVQDRVVAATTEVSPPASLEAVKVVVETSVSNE